MPVQLTLITPPIHAMIKGSVPTIGNGTVWYVKTGLDIRLIYLFISKVFGSARHRTAKLRLVYQPSGHRVRQVNFHNQITYIQIQFVRFII